MATNVGVSQVPGPAHVESDLLPVPFAEPGGHDHIFGSERLFLYELGEVFGEVGMNPVIIAEVEQPVTGRGGCAYVSFEERINGGSRQRTERQMPPTVPGVKVANHGNFIERLSENTGENQFIEELPPFLTGYDDTGEAHDCVRSNTYPVPVGVVPVPPCTHTRESVLCDGLMLMARYPGTAVSVLGGVGAEK